MSFFSSGESCCAKLIVVVNKNTKERSRFFISENRQKGLERNFVTTLKALSVFMMKEISRLIVLNSLRIVPKTLLKQRIHFVNLEFHFRLL